MPLLPLIASNTDWHYSILLDLRHSIIEVNESNTQDVNIAFLDLIPTETLQIACSLTLRAEIFVIVNCCRTYFCDFGSKSQKFDLQNTVLDKSIARISSTKYGFKASHKN